MLPLYTLGIRLYALMIRLAAPFNKQASKWISGRKGLKAKLSTFVPVNRKTIWIHCASLGEFEQARPVIEELRKISSVNIVLTFFSPSGYEIRKDYKDADLVVYLPVDLPGQVKMFLDAIKPDVAVFVKYEFWFNYIVELGRRKIPLFLISGLFRKDHFLLSGIGKSLLKHLRSFTHFYLQDKDSAELLKENGFRNVTVAGDTRFDRVKQIAAASAEIPLAAEFSKDSRVMVAGSTWPPDIEILKKFFASEKIRGLDLRLIIAPHHIDQTTLDHVRSSFPDHALFSKGKIGKSRVLIIDNIGMLSSLYRYGQVAYVGGGFGKAVHNVLEPAAYGIPVLFGPENKKFREIRLMKENQTGFEINEEASLIRFVSEFYSNGSMKKDLSERIDQFMESNSGAVSVICKDLSVLL